MSVTATIILDTRRMKKKSAKFPVKLLIIYKGDPKRYQTIYDLSKAEFDNLKASRVSQELKPTRDSLKQIQHNVDDFLNSLHPFSYNEFEKEFILDHPAFRQRKFLQPLPAPFKIECDIETYKNKFPIFKKPAPAPGTILTVFLIYIDRLLREHRIATATHYQTAYNTFERYGGNVLFTDITVGYLKQFEAWMLQDDYSITTVGIYTRCLRAMFNEADFVGIISKNQCYPFGRRKYRLPNSRNIKKALRMDDVAKIYNYAPICIQEKWAKDIWLFSYFGNGINTKDIIHLKWKNIDEEFMVFVRAKTNAATRENSIPISVFINNDMKRILTEWGVKKNKPDDYIFPVLTKEMSALQQFKQLGLFVRSINDWMAIIRKKLDIKQSVTTYVARHTFSTVLKKAGVSTEYIREALGHTSIQTTENYLDSFEKEMKKEYANKLMPFNSEFKGELYS
jgi:integrase/recombinase XerD